MHVPVNLYVTARKANDREHLAHLGDAFEDLRPSLVRRVGAERVIATFYVESNDLHAAVEAVADLVRDAVLAVPGTKIAYVRVNGITVVLSEQAPARLSGDPGTSPRVIVQVEPIAVGERVERQRPVSMEDALAEARKIVDDALSD